MDEEISRQHDETTMDELVGKTCDQFIGVFSPEIGGYLYFFLETGGRFHRFFLDAGLLFWRSDQSPDPEDDLSGGDCYEDLGEALNATGAGISAMAFADFVLVMRFENGARISFKNELHGVGCECVERQRGSD